MEDSQAAFVSMIVDRMHRLECTVTDLRRALFMDRDMIVFSDGWWLCYGFAQNTDSMRNGRGEKRPLDDLHLNVVVHRGEFVLKAGVGPDGLIHVGEGAEDVTVGQLLDAINAWCVTVHDGDTNYKKYMTWKAGIPRLGCLDTVCDIRGKTAYSMYLVWEDDRSSRSA